MDDTAACAATRHANQVHAVVERLALRGRWTLVLSGGNVHLPTGPGVAGLLADARLACRVRADVPALALSPTLWAFLVDPAGTPPPVLPAGAWLLDRGACLPLPPSVTAEGPVRWVREPRDVLPRLDAVVGLLHERSGAAAVGPAAVGVAGQPSWSSSRNASANAPR
ncbi:hypothetical protein [Saccharothrix longispora]|uniref:hypothetical protein n=1 Tax=Saccharothrix longispora TaxID=33920 RepID=UPI0028FD2987|nr:hypothetical protein [Saccharothrix longispora]MBY8850041.1 hypothetical protein [Saccharothrix sp. MB29]MDU0287983.1 hypothetical protein [Saccharothrix longispora]